MGTKTVAEKLQIKPNTTVWLSHSTHLGRKEYGHGRDRVHV